MCNELFEYSIKGDIENLKTLFEDPESVYVKESSKELNRRDEDGKTAMDLAAMLGRTEIIQELIDRGAEVNEITENGYSAMHRAACWGRIDCLRVLVANNADLQMKTEHGERARECASRYNQMACVEFLDIAEAQRDLLDLITSTKETIADPEKHMGRFTKDDRQSGNKYCDEKNEWLDANRDTATLDDVLKQKQALDELLKPILSKLVDTGKTGFSGYIAQCQYFILILMTFRK